MFPVPSLFPCSHLFICSSREVFICSSVQERVKYFQSGGGAGWDNFLLFGNVIGLHTGISFLLFGPPALAEGSYGFSPIRPLVS